jgi:GT2 family glycosyltransferase
MISEKPLISIIVINYNGRHFLKGCLSSLYSIDYPKSKYEVIMVDNGSTDGSIEYVKNNFSWVKILKLDKNYGFGGGNNKGARFAQGKYLVFLNNDTHVTKDWLSRLVKTSNEVSVVIRASKTLFMTDCNIMEYGGGKFTINGRGYSVALGKKNDGRTDCVYTGYPCAASMLINKDLFFELDGFDEDYFACLDDTDLGWRAWLYGYKVLYCPASVACHLAGGTAGRGRISPLKAFHGTKDSYLNILKNLELKNIVQGLVLAVIYDFVEFLLLLKRRDTECVKNKIRAYFWVIKKLHLIVKKRQVIYG